LRTTDQANLGKKQATISKTNKQKRKQQQQKQKTGMKAGGMPQAVGYLPSKCEALSSNYSTTKTKTK
jgi:hypothetical protein